MKAPALGEFRVLPAHRRDSSHPSRSRDAGSHPAGPPPTAKLNRLSTRMFIGRQSASDCECPSTRRRLSARGGRRAAPARDSSPPTIQRRVVQAIVLRLNSTCSRTCQSSTAPRTASTRDRIDDAARRGLTVPIARPAQRRRVRAPAASDPQLPAHRLPPSPDCGRVAHFVGSASAQRFPRASSAHGQLTVLAFPGRALAKSPTTVAASAAFTTSRRIRFTTFSWKIPRSRYASMYIL